MESTKEKKIEEEFKDFKPTYHERKLDICGICQKKYNVVNGETIKSLIVYDYNRNRMTWDWTCISINRKR